MTVECKKKWDELRPVYTELSALLSSLCDLEDSLSISASNNAKDKIDALVTEAQPTLLRFKGLEKKREKLQKELGLVPASLPSILEKAPDEEKEEWAEKNLHRFIQSKETADRIMQVRLIDVSQKLEGKTEAKKFRDRRV